MVGAPLVEVRDARKLYPAGGWTPPWRQRRWVRAVDGVSFTIHAGETLGLVGESGCGKTTTTRLLLLLDELTSGSIHFDGRDVSTLRGRELLEYREAVQAVFQDPYSSLSPRLRVQDIIAEPLEVQGRLSRAQIRARVGEALEMVGLNPEQGRLFPHEFSGGQRQRIAIARAMATRARLIILDEPVSALDVSIRAQIITLLEELQARLGLSYLFIGHDLATVAHISHRIAVMYLGKIVEMGESQAVSSQPQHPYTRALFAAALPDMPEEPNGRSDRARPAAAAAAGTVGSSFLLSGEVPSALNVPPGCRFHPRCPFAMPICSQTEPAFLPTAPDRSVACYLFQETSKPSTA